MSASPARCSAPSLVYFAEHNSGRSFEWDNATRPRVFPERLLEYGLWAAGAFTIGLGVLPVVAGLPCSWRPRAEPEHARPRRRHLRSRALARDRRLRRSTPPARRRTSRRTSPTRVVGAEPDLPRPLALRGDRARARATPCPRRRPRRVGRVRRPLPARLTTPYKWTPASTPTRRAWRSSPRRTGRTAGLPSTPRPSCSGCSPRRGRAARGRRSSSAGTRLSRAIAIAAAVLTLGWNVTGEVNAAAARRLLADQLMAQPAAASHLGRSRDGRRADALSSARRSPTRTASGCSSSGTVRSGGCGAWTARRRARDRRSRPTCSTRRASSTATRATGTPSPRTASSSPASRSARRVAGGSTSSSHPLRLASAVRGIFGDGWIGSNTDDNRVSAGYSRFVDPHPARDDVRHGRPEGVVQRQGRSGPRDHPRRVAAARAGAERRRRPRDRTRPLAGRGLVRASGRSRSRPRGRRSTSRSRSSRTFSPYLLDPTTRATAAAWVRRSRSTGGPAT